MARLRPIKHILLNATYTGMCIEHVEHTCIVGEHEQIMDTSYIVWYGKLITEIEYITGIDIASHYENQAARSSR